MSLKKDHTISGIHAGLVLAFVSLLLLFPGCSGVETAEKSNSVIIPPGWYLSLYNSAIHLIKAEENEPSYILRFDRSNDIEEADYYLRIAEAIYPENKKIEKITGDKTKNWYFERAWSYDTYKDCRIPYSLTGDAVAYYIEHYKNYKKNLNDAPQSVPGRENSINRVEFYYKAKVEKVGNTTVEGEGSVPKIRVNLELKWYEYCGQPCGWGFEKQREIVFAGKHKVLSIKGDGPADVWISSEKQPYGPNQWIRF